MRVLLLGMALAALTSGCGQSTAGSGQSLVVFAASSLHGVMQELGQVYAIQENRPPLTFNFAGSQQLASQLREGADADVFVAADANQMATVADAGRIDPGQVRVFACNELAVAVHDQSIRTLADLAEPGRKLVIAAKEVPVGRYTRQFLEKAASQPEWGESFRRGVLANVVSEEQSVRAVLSKVQVGEADAGIVYLSDVLSAQNFRFLAIPPPLNVQAIYPAAPIQDSSHVEQAQAFVDFLASDESATILTAHGFDVSCREAERLGRR